MKKAKMMTDAVLCVMYLVSVCIEYIPAVVIGDYIYLGEWCFLTGFLGGIFYLISFLLGLKDKDLAEYLHLNVTLMLALIFIATLLLKLNLEGAYWILHIFGPLLVMFRFFAFCDCRKITHASVVLTTALFPLSYILLSFVLLRLTGGCPFPASMVLTMKNQTFAKAIIAGLCLLIVAIGYGLFCLNRLLFKIRKRSS